MIEQGGERMTVCLRVSISVKRHNDQGNTYKGKHLVERASFIFRGLDHCHHGKSVEAGGMAAYWQK